MRLGRLPKVIDTTGSRPWSAIVWHHSATRDGVTNDWAGIRRYHMEEKGWANIGYHAGIERVNGVVQWHWGRPLHQEGGHCVGWNKIALGVCVVGNFDLAAPDAEIIRSCVDLGRALMAAFPAITPERNFYHRQFSTKTCPGSKFLELADFRKMLGGVHA